MNLAVKFFQRYLLFRAQRKIAIIRGMEKFTPITRAGRGFYPGRVCVLAGEHTNSPGINISAFGGNASTQCIDSCRWHEIGQLAFSAPRALFLQRAPNQGRIGTTLHPHENTLQAAIR